MWFFKGLLNVNAQVTYGPYIQVVAAIQKLAQGKKA